LKAPAKVTVPPGAFDTTLPATAMPDDCCPTKKFVPIAEETELQLPPQVAPNDML
jgi:hypothetical protein